MFRYRGEPKPDLIELDEEGPSNRPYAYAPGNSGQANNPSSFWSNSRPQDIPILIPRNPHPLKRKLDNSASSSSAPPPSKRSYEQIHAGCSHDNGHCNIESAGPRDNFYCSACKTGATPTMPTLISHLASEGHRQVREALLRETMEIPRERTVQIRSVLRTEFMTLLNYFQNWGKVEDFLVFQLAKKASFAEAVMVVFEEEKAAQEILGFLDYHIVGGKKLEVTKVEGFVKRPYKSVSEHDIDQAKAAQELDEYEAAHRAYLQTLLDGLDAGQEVRKFTETFSTSDGEYCQRVDFYVRDLKSIFKRLGYPLNSSELQLYGAHELCLLPSPNVYARRREIHLLLNLEGTETAMSLETHETQYSLVHMIRKGLHANLMLSSISTKKVKLAGNELLEISFTTPEFASMNTEFKLMLVRNALLIQETKLIAQYCDMDPRVRPMIQVIHEWSLCQGRRNALTINTSEMFPLQTVSWLVIFFLQQAGLLRPVCDWQIHQNRLKYRVQYVDGYEISFSTEEDEKKAHSLLQLEDATIFALSLLALLKSFFEFYSNSGNNFTNFTHALCPYVGKLIPKEHLFLNIPDNVAKLPEPFQQRYQQGGKVFQSSCFMLQDPLLLNRNLTEAKGVKSGGKFRSHCKATFQKMQSAFNEDRQNLREIFEQAINNKEPTTSNSKPEPSDQGDCVVVE